MVPLSFSRRLMPFILHHILLLVGCGGVVDTESASTVDTSGGTSSRGELAAASGGVSSSSELAAATAPESDIACMAASPEPIPDVDGCSETEMPCGTVPLRETEISWTYTISRIAYDCGAGCVALRLATKGNCVTAVRFRHEPYPNGPDITPESIVTCVTDKLIRQRFPCVPRDCWSEVTWSGCVLL